MAKSRDGDVDARATSRRAWVGDALGIVWVVVAGVAVLLPALAHGGYLGSYDWLTRFGLSQGSGRSLHNVTNRDQIDYFIPMTHLVWSQVHAGHVPLWNPYSALGTPLAFNWQSAPLALPSLVGYVLPVSWAYTAGILVTVVVAGTGVYFLGRVLRLGPLGSAVAAATFELSGPFVALLGWNFSGVMSWAGWLFGFGILLLRGEHRGRDTVLFAGVVAMAVYAGQPETFIIMAVPFAVFLLALVVLQPDKGGARTSVRRLGRVAVATVGGLGLGAPMLLPGAQLVGGAKRNLITGAPPLSAHELSHLIFQSFDGLPLAGSHWFGAINYVETTGLVGMLAVCLAVVALVGRGRKPEVAGLGLATIVTIGLVFWGPLVHFMAKLPGTKGILWYRALLVLALLVAVLAGVGADVLQREHSSPRVRRAALGVFLGAGLLLGLIWLVGRGHLPPAEEHIRAQSFVWPVIEVAAGVLVVGGLLLWHRAQPRDDRHGTPAGLLGTIAAGSLLTCSTVALLIMENPILSSSSAYLQETPAEHALARAVGPAVVGNGVGSCWVPPTLGILNDVNIAYGIDEFSVYDPALPLRYYDQWTVATGEPAGPSLPFNLFCPAVKTVGAARLFGIEYILEPHGAAGPTGSERVRAVGDEVLWRVPGAAQVVVVPTQAGSPVPVVAPGRTVPTSQPTPGSIRFVTDASVPSLARIRVTNVPGWHATIDGRPLRLSPFFGIMLQARVPPGRHVVELHYWPDALNAGLVIALLTALGLVAVVTASRIRREPRSAAPTQPVGA